MLAAQKAHIRVVIAPKDCHKYSYHYWKRSKEEPSSTKIDKDTINSDDTKTATMIILNIYVTPQYVFVSEFKVDDKFVVCVVNTGMIRNILL